MANLLDKAFNFQEQALKIHSYRQQLIASNISNADTPNYKAVDLDFASMLKRAQSGTSTSIPLQATAPGHLSSSSQNLFSSQTVYRLASQPSVDGNTVEMDTERSKFAENTIRYEAVFRFLNGQIKSLISAIQG